MGDIEDISSQLLRPPRELSSWKFPLGQVLQEYFSLLPDPQNIHYGEASLIIQNSVNAYARKVEELYEQTQTFNNKMIIEEKEHEEKQLQKNSKSNKQRKFDFSNFDIIDFDKDIGKNINLKSQDSKPIKFLHHCFSQLENSYAKIQIDIYDNEGEVIGKKYDFRCNQRTAKSGMLVAEFSPKDFEDNLLEENIVPSVSSTLNDCNETNEVPETVNKIVESIAETQDVINNTFDDLRDQCRSPSIQDSGYFSNNPIESPITEFETNIPSSTAEKIDNSNFTCDEETDDDSQANNMESSHVDEEIDEDEIELTGVSTLNAEPIEIIDEPEPNENLENLELESNSKNAELSQNLVEPDLNKLNSTEKNNDIIEQDESMVDPSNLVNEKLDDNSVNCIENKRNELNSDKNLETDTNVLNNKEINSEKESNNPKECDQNEIQEDSQVISDNCVQNQKKELSEININKIQDVVNNNNKRSCDESGNVNSNDAPDSNLRRSKRLKPNKTSNDNKNIDSTGLLKAIPFKDGIPDKLPKSRKEFRLPCNIALLKNSPKKRATGNKSKRRKRCIEEADDIQLLNTEKMNLFTPTKPIIRIKEEDNKGFRKSLDDCFNNTDRFRIHYDPVTNVSMDLLGFVPNYSINNSHFDDSAYIECSSFSASNLSSPRISPPCTPIPNIISASNIKISSSQKKK